MLNMNSASRAFENYEVQWTDERTSNDLLYVLQTKYEFQDETRAPGE